MVSTHGPVKARGGREDETIAPAGPSAGIVRQRPGVRLILLSLAAAILLVGALAAGTFGYLTIGHGHLAAAGGPTAAAAWRYR